MAVNTSDGSNHLARDAKLGNLVNSLGAGVVSAVVVWLGDIDWSSWPAWVVTLGPPAAGLAAGWLTSFKAARFKR
jgi:hypothetical protein